MPSLEHRFELAHPADEVLAWHTRPGALERLTPHWESVRVVGRSGGIEPGARVTLELRRGPVRLRWEAEHHPLRDGQGFVDEQVGGPFRRWRHEHRFESLAGERTAVVDRVEWEPPLGSLGDAFSEGYVRGALLRLFAFRERRLSGDLALHRRYGGGEGRTVAITGSGGLIGTSLSHLLTTGGYRVLRVTRSPERGEDTVSWDPARGMLDAGDLDGVDAVVHLAGEPIAGGRWNRSRKDEILRSREEGTLLLARTLATLASPPSAFVSASAVGYYGDRGDERLTEESGSGQGFLAEVCRRWEDATRPARSAGIRTIRLRSGLVLSAAGGVLGTILLPFRLGVGGRIGTGRQYQPWIDLDDETGLILHALRSEGVRGPMNATAPSPVPNTAFTDALGRVLGRPTLLPVPAVAIRTLLGEMGTELLLAGQRALPAHALTTGYAFRFEDVEASLRYQIGAHGADE